MHALLEPILEFIPHYILFMRMISVYLLPVFQSRTLAQAYDNILELVAQVELMISRLPLQRLSITETVSPPAVAQYSKMDFALRLSGFASRLSAQWLPSAHWSYEFMADETTKVSVSSKTGVTFYTVKWVLSGTAAFTYGVAAFLTLAIVLWIGFTLLAWALRTVWWTLKLIFVKPFERKPVGFEFPPIAVSIASANAEDLQAVFTDEYLQRLCREGDLPSGICILQGRKKLIEFYKDKNNTSSNDDVKSDGEDESESENQKMSVAVGPSSLAAASHERADAAIQTTEVFPPELSSIVPVSSAVREPTAVLDPATEVSTSSAIDEASTAPSVPAEQSAVPFSADASIPAPDLPIVDIQQPEGNVQDPETVSVDGALETAVASSATGPVDIEDTQDIHSGTDAIDAERRLNGAVDTQTLTPTEGKNDQADEDVGREACSESVTGPLVEGALNEATEPPTESESGHAESKDGRKIISATDTLDQSSIAITKDYQMTVVNNDGLSLGASPPSTSGEESHQLESKYGQTTVAESTALESQVSPVQVEPATFIVEASNNMQIASNIQEPTDPSSSSESISLPDKSPANDTAEASASSEHVTIGQEHPTSAAASKPSTSEVPASSSAIPHSDESAENESLPVVDDAASPASSSSALPSPPITPRNQNASLTSQSTSEQTRDLETPVSSTSSDKPPLPPPELYSDREREIWKASPLDDKWIMDGATWRIPYEETDHWSWKVFVMRNEKKWNHRSRPNAYPFRLEFFVCSCDGEKTCASCTLGVYARRAMDDEESFWKTCLTPPLSIDDLKRNSPQPPEWVRFYKERAGKYLRHRGIAPHLNDVRRDFVRKSRSVVDEITLDKPEVLGFLDDVLGEGWESLRDQEPRDQERRQSGHGRGHGRGRRGRER